jgi:hypothetical protein
MHAVGAQLCSTCSGVLLLAETGLLDGKDATVHWMYASTFHRNFPKVRLDRAVVAAGEHQEFLMSGASTSWHDLILYLIAQHAGPTAAQAVAKFFAFQWHADGQSPYVVFEPVTDHGDAAIHKAQSWLARHFSVANPIERPRASPEFLRVVLSGALRALQDTHQSIMFSGCVWKTRSGGSNKPMRRWMRSAGRWATKTPPFFAGYSNGSRA